jgi:hypothetical protein
MWIFFFSESRVWQCEWLKLCFIHLIQAEINRIAVNWDLLNIHKQKSPPEIPNGKPDLIYFLPEKFGGHNYGKINMVLVAKWTAYAITKDQPSHSNRCTRGDRTIQGITGSYWRSCLCVLLLYYCSIVKRVLRVYFHIEFFFKNYVKIKICICVSN